MAGKYAECSTNPYSIETLQHLVARHGFRNESGSLRVILAVELTDGGSFMTGQEVALPF